MARCDAYTVPQQAAFYAVGLGLTLCIAACVTPSWLFGKVITTGSALHSVQDSPDNIGFKVDAQWVDVRVGLWWYCLEGGDEQTNKCIYLYSPKTSQRELWESTGLSRLNEDEDPVFLFFVRTVMVMCLLTSLVGLLMVCFYCGTCCRDGQTLCFGIVFSIAGILGYAVLFMLTLNIDVLLNVPISEAKNGCAFPLFLTGNSILFVAGIFLCLPPLKQVQLPYKLIYPIKITHPWSTLNGHVSGLESLPPARTWNKTML